MRGLCPRTIGYIDCSCNGNDCPEDQRDTIVRQETIGEHSALTSKSYNIDLMRHACSMCIWWRFQLGLEIVPDVTARRHEPDDSDAEKSTLVT